MRRPLAVWVRHLLALLLSLLLMLMLMLMLLLLLVALRQRRACSCSSAATAAAAALSTVQPQCPPSGHGAVHSKRCIGTSRRVGTRWSSRARAAPRRSSRSSCSSRPYRRLLIRLSSRMSACASIARRSTLREAACTANLKSSCRAGVRVGKVRSRFLPPGCPKENRKSHDNELN